MSTNGRTVVVLTDDEKYHVYKYMIENRCIVQQDDMWRFRMQKSEILKEINDLNFLGRKIKDYHVRNSVDVVIDWQRRLNNVPQFKETMEIEQLREQHTRDINEIEKLKLQLKTIAEQLQITDAKLKEKTAHSSELAIAVTKLGKIKSILGD